MEDKRYNPYNFETKKELVEYHNLTNVKKNNKEDDMITYIAEKK